MQHFLTGQESWNIYKRDDGDVETIAESDKASSLHWGVDVQATYM